MLRRLTLGLPALCLALSACGGGGGTEPRLQGVPIKKTWVGGNAQAPNSWEVDGNWSPAGIPFVTDTILIPSSSPYRPVLSGDETIGPVTVQAGTSIETSGYGLVVKGSVLADGAIIGDGHVEMTGPGTLRGTVTSLTVSAVATLGGDLTVNGTLNLSTGNLTVAGHVVNVSQDFLAEGGTVTMTNAADDVRVKGLAQFQNMDETGKLTLGTIRVGGDFTLGCYNDTEFVSGGTVLILNGTAPQVAGMGCSGAARSRVFSLSIAAGSTVRADGNPFYVVSTLSVAGTLSVPTNTVVDVAGPAGSVTILAGGRVTNSGTLKANLPITNQGTLTGNPAVQR